MLDGGGSGGGRLSPLLGGRLSLLLQLLCRASIYSVTEPLTEAICALQEERASGSDKRGPGGLADG